MVFRWKIVALILSAVLLLNVGVYLASRHTMFMGYVTLEEQLGRDHLERVRQSLQDDLDDLVSLNVDWSAWDDTYDFVSTHSAEYVESNLVPSTFDELGLNLIMLLDSRGNVVYSGAYDLNEELMVPLPEVLGAHLKPGSPLLTHSGPESRLSGIINLPQGPLLISSCPVITSEMSGPVAGTFIMGCFVDQEKVSELAGQTQLVLSLVPFAQLPSLAVGSEGSRLRYLDDQKMEGVVAFEDIYGKTAFAFLLDIPRHVSLQGRSTLDVFFTWNLLLTLAVALLAYLVIDRWLTNREERLETEERFRLMFVHSEAGMCTVRKNGRIMQVNKAFSKIFGHPEEDLVDQDIAEFVNPIDRGWIASFFAFGNNSRGISGSLDCRFIHQSGKTIWSKVSIGWINSPVRKSEYATLMVQDLSDRKKVEDQLKTAVKQAQDAQDRTKAILRSASDGLMLVDQDLIVRLINPATEELLGLSSHDITHRPVNTFLDSKGLMTLLENVRAGVTPGESCDVEVPGSGSYEARWIRFYASPVVSRNGKRESIIISLHDRTRDHELDRMKNDFITTAAHELRTPLTAVMGFSELLLDEQAVNRQERQTYLGYIYEKSQALDGIVNELLNLERISSGRKIELKKAPVSCKELVQKAIDQFQASWNEHQFYVDFPDEETVLNLDARKIEQVLQNLISNAVKYSPVGGRVWVKGQLLENEFRINVEDQGVGMTASELEKVFERFYRCRSTAELADGIGIGLTICKEIVEEHGGRIWLKSVYGEGTRVYVALPLDDGKTEG